MADYGFTTTHGRANNKGVGDHRSNKEASHNRAGAGDQGVGLGFWCDVSLP